MKFWLKALLGGVMLTGIDWLLTGFFPALRSLEPFAVIQKRLFQTLIWMGMNVHSPSLRYGLLGLFLLFAFFTILCVLVIALYAVLRRPSRMKLAR